MTKNAQTIDIQAPTFGVAPNVASAFLVTQNTTCTISGLAVTSAAITARTLNDAAGQMILTSSNATFGTAGTVLYGIVQSNTASTTSVFTVDDWYTLAGVGGQTAVTGFYVLLPVTAPFWYIALSDSVSAVTSGSTGTDTGVAMGGTEWNASGLARGIITSVTRSIGNASLTLAKTFTYTGSVAATIGRCAITNSAKVNKNYGYFFDQINSGTPAVVSSSGDTFTPTYTITLG